MSCKPGHRGNHPVLRLTPTRRRRTKRQAAEAYEAECRRRRQALAAVIKAKLVAVEDGISTNTHEAEFLAYVVLSDGRTIGEWAGPGPCRPQRDRTKR
jgi:hypothetical protein